MGGFSSLKAQLLDSPKPIEQDPLRFDNLADPSPASDEVLIRVKACGVCRSNLHMIEGDWVHLGVPSKSPIIPGHEVVGVVDKLGRGLVSNHYSRPASIVNIVLMEERIFVLTER